MTSPGHLRNRDPMLSAANPGGFGLEIRWHCSKIESPPASAPLTLVVAASDRAASPAAGFQSLRGAYVSGHDARIIVILDGLDHGRLLDSEHTPP